MGMIAAALAIVADLSLQFTTTVEHLGSKEYAYLLDVSRARLLVGHYLGVPAVLLEIVAFWAIARRLERAGPVVAGAFRWLATAAFALGAAFHAMFAAIGSMLREAVAGGVGREVLARMTAEARTAHEGLGAVTVLAIVASSLVFSIAVARGRTPYPRWLAAASPFALALVFALVARLLPSTRLVLLPAGLNGANLLFFVLAQACEPAVREGGGIGPAVRSSGALPVA